MIQEFELNSVGIYPTFPAELLQPDKFSLVSVDSSTLYKMKNLVSNAISRKSPGRQLSYFVNYDNRLIGLVNLSSPVITLGVRDKFLNLPADGTERGKSLRNYMDMSVCVGIQPISWYWNIGKLLAMTSVCLEIQNDFRIKYGDSLTGVTTTGLNGPSSQYNKVMKFLGYTKGFGHEHISDEEYKKMMEWMRQNNVSIPSKNNVTNPRMRNIMAYNKANNIKATMNHGNLRGVYYLSCSTESFNTMVQKWYNRFGMPRWTLKQNELPPYHDGKKTLKT